MRKPTIYAAERRRIHFIEIPSELGAGTRGASLGVNAVKTAALVAGSSIFGQHPTTSVADENHRLHLPKNEESPFLHAKHIDGVLRTYEHIVYTINPLLRMQDCFPIILSGDHSSSAAALAAWRINYPTARIGAVWIDAHADLHTPYTTPSGNLHGMPLAVCLGIDNRDCQRNTLNSTTKLHWRKLQHLGNIYPKLRPEDLAFVSLRSTEREEDYFIQQHSIPCYRVPQIRVEGAKKVAERILEQLNDCDMIYISFDVDSLDCELVSHGTGTPEKEGLTIEEARILLTALAADARACCVEFTEINPALDEKCNRMAETAFNLLSSVAATVQQRQFSLADTEL